MRLSAGGTSELTIQAAEEHRAVLCHPVGAVAVAARHRHVKGDLLDRRVHWLQQSHD
jgi:hypothetical protein